MLSVGSLRAQPCAAPPDESVGTDMQLTPSAHARRLALAGAVIALAAVAIGSSVTEARRRRPPRPQPAGVTAASLPALPADWPATLHLGMADSPGGAAAMQQTAPFGFRYQYLAGGVNTGNGWATWNTNGQFVTYYVQDSVANAVVPVFTYYMIRQSAPGDEQYEPDGVANNLQNTATMTTYYADLKLFFQRAGAFPGTMVVLHVEPDMWGYMQQRATADNAASVPVKVAATGTAELTGLPDTAVGFAQAVKRLRDQYAPNVVLAYHLSIWGTNNDIIYGNYTDAQVDALAARSAAFYASLGTNFDIAFVDQLDRDAGFKQVIDGNPDAWYDAADYARTVRYYGDFVAATQKRLVVWQIPYGNTKMRAMNNTWNHYQDNHAEWLLDEPARTHLAAYVNAGVVAFMFGGGASGTTCACDAAGDGVTNPAPINGNTLASLNADDDGGFFRQKAAAYYAAGAMPLTGPIPTPTPTPTRTSSPTPTRTPSPTPTRTPTPDVRIPANETLVPIPH